MKWRRMWGKVAMPSDTCADIYMFYRGSKGWFCMPDGFQGLFPVMLLCELIKDELFWWFMQGWRHRALQKNYINHISDCIHVLFYVQMIATFILVFLIKQPPKILRTQCGCMSFLWWDSYNSVIHRETLL